MGSSIQNSGFGSGFAAAVLPISAATITTDTTGLIAGSISIPTSDRDIPGYRAMPAEGKGFPLTLVVHEVFGVHEHIKDICRRLAKLGQMAVAPELYIRQGEVSKIPNIQEIISKVVSKVPDAQVISDLDATVSWAERTGAADMNRLGITGFCWGGRITWLYAAHSSQLKAGVAWYGRLTGPNSAATPKHPLDIASDLKAPVLGLYGGKDQSIPLSTVEQMREAVKAAHKTAEIIVYPEAGHAFNSDYRPSYNEAAAKDGWHKLNNWLKQYGAS